MTLASCYEHAAQAGLNGNCRDNAVAESFFGSYKVELVYDEDFETREEARAKTFEYIEAFYNSTRRLQHLAISAQRALLLLRQGWLLDVGELWFVVQLSKKCFRRE